MKWTFSDGTVFHLGGKVEGDSVLAKYLRAGADGAMRGQGPIIYTAARDIAHVDYWVRNAARCLSVEVLTAPEVPEFEGERSAPPSDPTAVN